MLSTSFLVHCVTCGLADSREFARRSSQALFFSLFPSSQGNCICLFLSAPQMACPVLSLPSLPPPVSCDFYLCIVVYSSSRRRRRREVVLVVDFTNVLSLTRHLFMFIPPLTADCRAPEVLKWPKQRHLSILRERVVYESFY